MAVKINWGSLLLLCYCSILFGFMSSVILQQKSLPYIGVVALLLGLSWRWIWGPIIELVPPPEKGESHE